MIAKFQIIELIAFIALGCVAAAASHRWLPEFFGKLSPLSPLDNRFVPCDDLVQYQKNERKGLPGLLSNAWLGLSRSLGASKSNSKPTSV